MTCNSVVPVMTKISSANYNEDSSAGKDSPATVMTMMTAIIIMATVFHELPFAIYNDTVYFAAIDAESSADNTKSSTITMITTLFHESPSAIHHGIFYSIDDAVTRTTTSYMSPFYILILSLVAGIQTTALLVTLCISYGHLVRIKRAG